MSTNYNTYKSNLEKKQHDIIYMVVFFPGEENEVAYTTRTFPLMDSAATENLKVLSVPDSKLDVPDANISVGMFSFTIVDKAETITKFIIDNDNNLSQKKVSIKIGFMGLKEGDFLTQTYLLSEIKLERSGAAYKFTLGNVFQNLNKPVFEDIEQATIKLKTDVTELSTEIVADENITGRFREPDPDGKHKYGHLLLYDTENGDVELIEYGAIESLPGATEFKFLDLTRGKFGVEVDTRQNKIWLADDTDIIHVWAKRGHPFKIMRELMTSTDPRESDYSYYLNLTDPAEEEREFQEWDNVGLTFSDGGPAALFDPDAGRHYGWDLIDGANMSDFVRKINPDMRLDSHVSISNLTTRYFRATAPAGWYKVTMVLGDAAFDTNPLVAVNGVFVADEILTGANTPRTVTRTFQVYDQDSPVSGNVTAKNIVEIKVGGGENPTTTAIHSIVIEAMNGEDDTLDGDGLGLLIPDEMIDRIGLDRLEKVTPIYDPNFEMLFVMDGGINDLQDFITESILLPGGYIPTSTEDGSYSVKTIGEPNTPDGTALWEFNFTSWASLTLAPPSQRYKSYLNVQSNTAYSAEQGFGWLDNLDTDGRSRTEENGLAARGPDHRYDTFCFRNNSDPVKTFQCDVPNGFYLITVAGGDTYNPQDTLLTINGVEVINQRVGFWAGGFMNAEFAETQILLHVTTGNLQVVIGGHSSGTNNSIINFLTVQSVTLVNKAFDVERSVNFQRNWNARINTLRIDYDHDGAGEYRSGFDYSDPESVKNFRKSAIKEIKADGYRGINGVAKGWPDLGADRKVNLVAQRFLTEFSNAFHPVKLDGVAWRFKDVDIASTVEVTHPSYPDYDNAQMGVTNRHFAVDAKVIKVDSKNVGIKMELRERRKIGDPGYIPPVTVAGTYNSATVLEKQYLYLDNGDFGVVGNLKFDPEALNFETWSEWEIFKNVIWGGDLVVRLANNQEWLNRKLIALGGNWSDEDLFDHFSIDPRNVSREFAWLLTQKNGGVGSHDENNHVAILNVSTGGEARYIGVFPRVAEFSPFDLEFRARVRYNNGADATSISKIRLGGMEFYEQAIFNETAPRMNIEFQSDGIFNLYTQDLVPGLVTSQSTGFIVEQTQWNIYTLRVREDSVTVLINGVEAAAFGSTDNVPFTKLMYPFFYAKHQSAGPGDWDLLVDYCTLQHIGENNSEYSR